MIISRLNIIIFIFYSYSFAICEDKGIKLYNNNQFDKAKEYYEKILLERKEDAIASFGLGATAFQQNDFSLAMKGFESSLNTDNKELKSSAYYNMANVLAENERLEESLAFYRQSLVLNPNDLDSKINYELVKFRLQQEQNNESQESNEDEINKLVDKVLENHYKSVEEYMKGKDKLFGFFIGEVMKESKGKANPKIVNKILRERLKK